MQQLQYVRIEIKKMWAVFFRQLYWILALFLVSILFFVGFCYVFSPQKGEPAIKAAISVPGDQKEIVMMAKALSTMDSIKNTVKFVYPTEEEAYELLDKGEINLAIFLGENFYDDVNTGINTPVSVVFANPQDSTNDGIKELIKAGIGVVDITEAASYAIEEVYSKDNSSFSIWEIENALMKDYINTYLSIRKNTNIEILSATGDVAWGEYYVTCAMIVMQLLLGIGLGGIYDRRDKIVEDKLKVYGVTPVFCSVIKVMLIAVSLFIMSAPAMFIICKYFKRILTIKSIGLLLLESFSVAGILHGFFSFGNGKRERKGIMCLGCLILLLVSGCIVPIAFFDSDIIKSISSIVPFNSIRNNLQCMLLDTGNFNLYMVIFGIVMFILGTVYTMCSSSEATSSEDIKYAVNTIWRSFYAGGFKNNIHRMVLLIKWQIKRKVIIVYSILFVILFACIINIQLPVDNNVVYYFNDSNVTELQSENILKESVFNWEKVNEKDFAKDEVLAGRAVAYIENGDDGINVYVSALLPKVLIAKETYNVYAFSSLQNELISARCDNVFYKNSEEIKQTAVDLYNKYLNSGMLFRVEIKSR